MLNLIRPDFPSYRKDPSTAPGAGLFNNPNVEKLSTINMNGADCKVPVIYKANLSYTHFFSDRLKMSVAGYMTLGRNNYMYVDVTWWMNRTSVSLPKETVECMSLQILSTIRG